MGRRRLVVALGLVYLYVLGMGFLAGVLVDRVRFDERRAEVLRHLTLTEARLHARLMRLEGRAEGEAGRGEAGRGQPAILPVRAPATRVSQ
jgi:hypothetical protein